MVTLTADDHWLLKDLRGFVEPVEIYDVSGKFLGLFVPNDLERGKKLYAEAMSKIDRVELERRRQSKEKGIPLQEALGHLTLLEKEMERRKAAGEKEFTTQEALAYFRSLRSEGILANETGHADIRTESDRCATP